jgi:hypothetical protein
MSTLLLNIFKSNANMSDLKVAFQNLAEKSFVLQNTLRCANSCGVRFTAKENIVCLLRSLMDLVFSKRRIKSSSCELVGRYIEVVLTESTDEAIFKISKVLC